MSTLDQIKENIKTSKQSLPLSDTERTALGRAMEIYQESAPLKQGEIDQYKGHLYHEPRWLRSFRHTASARSSPTPALQTTITIWKIHSPKNHIWICSGICRKLSTLTHCGYGAKTVLIFTYNQEEDWKNPLEKGVRSGIEDVSIVATYIMLQAIELGVYSTWCNYFSNTELEKNVRYSSKWKSGVNHAGWL